MQAIMRSDEHHAAKHHYILTLIKERPIGTIFFGDSLVRRWEEHPALWQYYFSPFEPANFGIGADRLEHMKWRVLNGEIDGVAPRVLVFLGGTNNLPDQDAPTVAAGIKDVIGIISSHLAHTQIVLLALLPRSGSPFAQKIGLINDELRLWSADQGRIHYLDLGPCLSADTITLDSAVSDDGLHLNAQGYERIGPLLASTIAGLFNRYTG